MRRAALLLALVSAPAAAQRPCVTDAEAQAFASVAMPEIIRETGRTCAALPANSLVRRQSGTFLAKYDAEADRAWPVARTAIVKLSDPAIDLLLRSEYARPLITSLLVPQIVGRIAVADCPMIDRLVTLMEPLPARHTAGIVVTALRYLKAEKAKGRTVDVPDLPLCTEAR